MFFLIFLFGYFVLLVINYIVSLQLLRLFYVYTLAHVRPKIGQFRKYGRFTSKLLRKKHNKFFHRKKFFHYRFSRRIPFRNIRSWQQFFFLLRPIWAFAKFVQQPHRKSRFFRLFGLTSFYARVKNTIRWLPPLLNFRYRRFRNRKRNFYAKRKNVFFKNYWRRRLFMRYASFYFRFKAMPFLRQKASIYFTLRRFLFFSWTGFIPSVFLFDLMVRLFLSRFSRRLLELLPHWRFVRTQFQASLNLVCFCDFDPVYLIITPARFLSFYATGREVFLFYLHSLMLLTSFDLLPLFAWRLFLQCPVFSSIGLFSVILSKFLEDSCVAEKERFWVFWRFGVFLQLSHFVAILRAPFFLAKALSSFYKIFRVRKRRSLSKKLHILRRFVRHFIKARIFIFLKFFIWFYFLRRFFLSFFKIPFFPRLLNFFFRRYNLQPLLTARFQCRRPRILSRSLGLIGFYFKRRLSIFSDHFYLVNLLDFAFIFNTFRSVLFYFTVKLLQTRKFFTVQRLINFSLLLLLPYHNTVLGVWVYWTGKFGRHSRTRKYYFKYNSLVLQRFTSRVVFESLELISRYGVSSMYWFLSMRSILTDFLRFV